MYEPLRIGILLHRFICRSGGCSIGGDMKEHKHAAVLRAIADGVPMREFEVRNKCWDEDNWALLEIYLVESLIYYEDWEVRRKQQFITVNGFKVPKPVESVLPKADYYIAVVRKGTPCVMYLFNNIEDLTKEHCATNTVHLTEKAAIAHAKAMLGIDPESNHE